jgi:hypothetical protein
MKGIVEIYSINEETNESVLLHKESNLIVDNAGKTLVDLLTISPSLSAIPTASALLDTSNYTIQAITFGAPSGAYTRNIHSTEYPEIVSAMTYTSAIVLQLGSTASGYYPPTDIAPPKYPNPIDQKLENYASPSGTWSGINLSLPFTTSAGLTIEDLGHHLNIGGISSLAATVNPRAGVAFVFGSYAVSEVVGSVSAFTISSVNQIDTTVSPPVVSACVRDCLVGGNTNYNARQLIDYNGFITNISTAANNPTPNFISSAGSGVQLSALGNFASTGELVYGTRLAATDVAMLNINGGIYNIGLWTLDLQKSIQAGNSPPYSFSPLNNPRKYRLFCKKTFTKNLCESTDFQAPRALQIVWRIKFL